jgi:uncharacterized protein (TIGR02569 family)
VSATAEPPPDRVRAAFGVTGSDAEFAPPGPGWRCGDVELRPVADPARAAWVAHTMETLQVPGLRIARPLRSTDGRWVVGGWRAVRALAGRVEQRHDEVVSVAVRLHQATAGIDRPKFLAKGADVFAVADRAAWGEEEPELAPELGGRLFTILAGSRRPTGARPQLVHGDLFGTVLFCDEEPPAVTDFVPYWRPAEWAAAVVVVDALAWGDADPGILRRWAHLPEWPAMLLRALLFRLAVHALHPASTAESLRGLEKAAHLITEG